MAEAPPEKSPPPLPPETVVVAVQSASPWKSKTLWMAVIGELINIFSAPVWVKLLGGETATIVVGTVTLLLMAVMRVITFTPLTGTPGATAALAAHPAAIAASVGALTPTLVEKP